MDGEYLIKLIQKSGAKVRRIRPKEEKCWGEVNIGEGVKLEIKNRHVLIRLPMADIQISTREIEDLQNGCICVGREEGFINIYTRDMPKEKEQ